MVSRYRDTVFEVKCYVPEVGSDAVRSLATETDALAARNRASVSGETRRVLRSASTRAGRALGSGGVAVTACLRGDEDFTVQAAAMRCGSRFEPKVRDPVTAART